MWWRHWFWATSTTWSGLLLPSKFFNHLLWNCTVGTLVPSYPVLSPRQDVVYAGSGWDLYAINASSGVKIWNYTTGGEIWASPALSTTSDIVYVGSRDGVLRAINASSGGLLWNYKVPVQVQSDPAVSPSGDMVYIGADNIYAINASNGVEVWNYTAEVTGSNLVLSEDVLYAGSGWSLNAINASDGEEIWKFTTGDAIESSPALSPSGDIIYVGSIDWHVYAINASSARQIWNYTTEDGVTSRPAVSRSSEVVYVASNDRNLYAVNASTSLSVSERWTFMTGDGVYTTPAVSPSGDVVFVASGDKNLLYTKTLYALDTSRGALRWNCTIGDKRITSPSLSPSGDTIFVGSYDTSVRAINASNGIQIWRYTTGDIIVSPPALSPSGDMVYVGSNDHNLHAINASNGLPIWRYPCGDSVSSTAAFSPSGDIIYFGSNDYHVYAINASSARQIWNYTTGYMVFETVAVSPLGDVLFALSGDCFLYSINTSSGLQVWNFSICGSTRPVTSPSGDIVYVAEENSLSFHAINASSGAWLWSYLTGDEIVSTPALSPSGDIVYVGSKDKNLYALDAIRGVQLWNRTTGGSVGSPVLSPSGDALFVGSTDNTLYAMPTNTRTIWHFPMGGRPYSFPVLNPSGDVLYAGSRDQNLYAINASNGKVVGGFFHGKNPTLSATGDVIYFGTEVGVSAYRTQPQPYDLVPTRPYRGSWGEGYLSGAGMWALLGLVCLLMWPCRSARGAGMGAMKVTCFGLAGAIFGLAVGAIVASVAIILPGGLSPLFAEEHNFQYWCHEGGPSFGGVIVGCMVGMAVVWASCAIAAVTAVPAYGRLTKMTSTTTITTTPSSFSRRGRRGDPLSDFNNLMVVVTSLLVGFNVVPAWWMPDGRWFKGSDVGVLVAMMVCSLPLGLLVALLELALVEGLYVLLVGGRPWRGHLLRASQVVLPSYLWGFFTLWASTMIALGLFNQRGQYVPPFSPLCLLGLVAGCGAWGWKVWTAPSPSHDKHGWVRQRAMDVKVYLTWWPGWVQGPSSKDKEACLTKWKSLTSQYCQDLSPVRVLTLGLNAWCPDWCGVRRYMSSRSILHLKPSFSGCQPSLNDELDWALVRYVGSTLLSIAPLFIYWFYQRFFDESPRSLSIDLGKSLVGFYGVDGEFHHSPLPESFPIKTLQEAEHHYPMVYDGPSPFMRCDYDRSQWAHALDVGNFHMCLNQSWATTCLGGGGGVDVCPSRCKRFASTVIAQQSHQGWFCLQLVVYMGFLLFASWVIAQEKAEKAAVCLSLRHGRLFRVQKRTTAQTLAAVAFLIMLTAVYWTCLLNEHKMTEYFLILPRAVELERMMVHGRGYDHFLDMLRALSRKTFAVLVWYCEAALDAAPLLTSQLLIAYSDNDSTPLEVAAVQALYFAYQCYSIMTSQRKIYDFVDPDVIFTAHLQTDNPAEDVSYWSIYEASIKKEKAMDGEGVAQCLHEEVYVPFLLYVHQNDPHLMPRLFSQAELGVLKDVLEEEGGEVKEEP